MGPKAVGQSADLLGTVLGTYGQYQAGKYLDAQGRAVEAGNYYVADQLDVNAGQQRASGQRAMLNERRKEKLVQSNLQAAVAKGGGNSQDPSLVKLSEDIAAEGEYRALSALFQGEENARVLENEAKAKRWEGSEYRRMGKIGRNTQNMKAATTLLGGTSSFFSKYGST